MPSSHETLHDDLLTRQLYVRNPGLMCTNVTFVMQCSVTKKTVRVIFASQFQSSLLCIFWKVNLHLFPLSSTRSLLNQIQQDLCRVALLNTYEVSFAFFLWLEICLGCLWKNEQFEKFVFWTLAVFVSKLCHLVNTVIFCSNSSSSLVTGLI